MKLENYLTDKKLTQSEFAAMVGVEQSAVSQWLSGLRTPRDAFKKKIFEVTKGAVTANDFVEGLQ